MKTLNKKIIVILGPTASGKTGLSLELAKKLDIEIISSDSRQIYKHTTIGTAKPNADELSQAKHHLIDFLDLDKDYSAGKFANDATEIANDIISRGKVPCIVGGTGLYVQALCDGFFEEPAFDISKREELRKTLESRLELEGRDKLFENLQEIDPEAAKLYIEKNPRRILRALEYYQLHGETFSEAWKKYHKASEFESLYFGITYPREILYDRINRRVDIMWNEGLLEETKNILEMGYSRNLNSLNTVGYKETIAFIKGEMDMKEAVSEMKKNTRRYAKRQETWFRRNEKIAWLSGKLEEMAEKIASDYLSNNKEENE